MSKILKLSENLKLDLVKKHYGIFNHSAVQICSWNKKSLLDKGVCYKEKFYGVDCHRCMQFSPCSMWCQQNCSFCWRPMEFMSCLDIKEENVNLPEEIISNLDVQRNKLISGFGGNLNVNLKKLEESKVPNHFAISLSGEPTLYPKLNSMIYYLRSLKQTKSIFIVSNGQECDYFKNLIGFEKDFAPTQLYISIDASDKFLFDKINRSFYKDGWERLNKSLKYFSQILTRRVFRMTQIKGLNDLDSCLKGYKNLIDLGMPDIIEVKAYMFLGLSRKRHTKEQMPSWEDVLDFAKRLENVLPNYKIEATMQESLILILRNQKSCYGLKISPFENQFLD